MTSNSILNITTTHCEISELARYRIQKALTIIAELPPNCELNANIERTTDKQWRIHLSLRCDRGHLSTINTGLSQKEVIEQGLAEFTRSYESHKPQSTTKNFHFDKTGEFQ